MKVTFTYPFLRLLSPDPGQTAVLQGFPWAMATDEGFAVYWTYLDILNQRLFGLQIDPAAIEEIGKLVSIRSDLKHLGTWNRDRLRGYFYEDFKPRDYQVDGIYQLLRTKRSILADGTGLGKTLQAAGAVTLHAFANPKDQGTVVVLCPSGIRYQWRRQVTSMLRHPGTEDPIWTTSDFVVLDGPPAARRGIYRRKPPAWAVLPYELFIRDFDEIDRWLTASGVRAVIVDESSRVKTATTTTFQKVSTLIEHGRPELVYLLNATPIENGLHELWAQFRIACPWIFPSFPAFEQAYVNKLKFRWCRRCGHYSPKPQHFKICTAQGSHPWRADFEKVVGYQNLAEVRMLIRDRFIRRDYSDVDEQLPEIVVLNVEVDLLPEQKAAYEAVKRDTTLDPRERVNQLVLRALFDFRGAGGKLVSSKLAELVELLKQIGDTKAILVAESKVFVHLVEALLAKAGWKIKSITGDVAAHDRETIEREFTKGDLQLLIGTSAIERGPNLQAAGWVFNLDLPWNPAKWIQRVGRARRIGARHAQIRVINMIARGTVEQRIQQVVYEKLGLFKAIFGGDVDEATFASKVNFNELLGEAIE